MQTVLKPPLSTPQKPQKITTTLYELVEKIQTAVGSEHDELVVATVMDILRSRRATFLNRVETYHCN